jgi:hypothetical protein
VIEIDIVNALNNNSAITDLVDGRIYPLYRPQSDPLPALVYQRVSTTPENALQGFSGLDAVRLQFSCYAKTLIEAKELAVLLRAALDGDPSIKSTCVMEMDEQDLETRNFRTIVDFNVWQRYES